MRDRALIDLFGYTGQRLRVIQSLKIEDVDVEEGVYYLPDVEGLKDTDRRGRKRPLLGARKSAQEWIQMHATQEPDDILITAFEENTGGAEPGEELSATTIQRAIERCADRAGVDKPTNPPAFRHFFVTIARSQYKMDDATIKHLIGRGPGSRAMETTYAHLDDDAHIREAREAMGREVGDDETTLAPPVCPTCGTPLKPDAEECPTPTCSERFVPGPQPAHETHPDAAVRAGYQQAEDMDRVEKLQMLDELLDDPEVRAMMDDGSE